MVVHLSISIMHHWKKYVEIKKTVQTKIYLIPSIEPELFLWKNRKTTRRIAWWKAITATHGHQKRHNCADGLWSKVLVGGVGVWPRSSHTRWNTAQALLHDDFLLICLTKLLFEASVMNVVVRVLCIFLGIFRLNILLLELCSLFVPVSVLLLSFFQLSWIECYGCYYYLFNYISIIYIITGRRLLLEIGLYEFFPQQLVLWPKSSGRETYG